MGRTGRESTTVGDLKIRCLYRYQPFDLETRLRPALEGQLYCASPGGFNDPWDCHPCFNLQSNDQGSVSKTIQWILKACQKHRNYADDEIGALECELTSDPELVRQRVYEISTGIGSEIDRSWRVCCFSCKSDSTLMWSHYAQNHHGFCLEFSTCNPVLCGTM